jgi:DHA1 family bicyclomycin/chloramphenicol resistance-like MFS transporter
MLHLALGASGLTLAGVVGWWRYHRVTRQPLDQPLAGAGTAAMQAEIAEPR